MAMWGRGRECRWEEAGEAFQELSFAQRWLCKLLGELMGTVGLAFRAARAQPGREKSGAGSSCCSWAAEDAVEHSPQPTGAALSSPSLFQLQVGCTDLAGHLCWAFVHYLCDRGTKILLPLSQSVEWETICWGARCLMAPALCSSHPMLAVLLLRLSCRRADSVFSKILAARATLHQPQGTSQPQMGLSTKAELSVCLKAELSACLQDDLHNPLQEERPELCKEQGSFPTYPLQ